MTQESFTYGQVQRALAAVHHIPADDMGWFRGRITNFQKTGLVPASPGRGRRVAYRREDVFLWAMALEFSKWGWDPTLIKWLVHNLWVGIKPILLEASDGPDKYFYFQPNFLGRLVPKDEREAVVRAGMRPAIMNAVASDFDELDKQAKTDQGRATLKRFRDEHGKINLSRVRRDVKSALGEAIRA